MSGRAGRRGFDIKGDVYFFGIPEVRIRQLMSSGLPQIQGNFPVTATCILRLILMCNTGIDPADAVKRVGKIIIVLHVSHAKALGQATCIDIFNFFGFVQTPIFEHLLKTLSFSSLFSPAL